MLQRLAEDVLDDYLSVTYDHRQHYPKDIILQRIEIDDMIMEIIYDYILFNAK